MNRNPPKISGGKKKKKKTRTLSKKEQKEKLRTRLKDALWSLRQRFVGMPIMVSVDRIMPFLAFDQRLSQDQLNDLFPDYPSRLPEDFQMVTIHQIRQVIQAYWLFTQQGIGQFPLIFKAIIVLEQIARDGFEAYMLVEDRARGFQLTRKPKDWR